MSKHHSKIDGQFAPRRIEMLRSPAFRVLSLSALRILDRLEIELADHGGRDNGRLPVTFTDLREFGIANGKLIARGLHELRALGFIELMRAGRAGNGEHRTPNLFRITYLRAGDKGPTDEWQRVATIEEAKRIKKIFTSTGKRPGTSTGKRPKASTGKRPNTPFSPVPESDLLSRKDLSSLEGHRPEYGLRSAPNPTRRRRRHDWSRIRAAVKLNGGHHGES
jgi:hypothetical protein